MSEQPVRTDGHPQPLRRGNAAWEPAGIVSPWLRATVALLVLLGIFFRAYRLDYKVFWEDEILGTLHMQGYTEAEVVKASPRLIEALDVQRYLHVPRRDGDRPLWATVRSLAVEDPQHPPLYYLAARLWTQLFGTSAAAVRSLSTVFGVIALPCVYWLCLELFGSTETALVALALFALSPFYVLYAQEAREYSLWTVVVLLDALLLLRASRSTARSPWIAYGVLTALGLYVYPLTGLVALGFGAYLIFRERLRPTSVVRRWAVATLAAFAAFAPWLNVMASSHGLERGMAGIVRGNLSALATFEIFARDLRAPFFDLGQFRVDGLSSTVVNLPLTIVVVALCAYALAALVRDRPFTVWGFVVTALCIPMVVLVLIDPVRPGHFVYQARYFIPLLLGVQLSVASLLAAAIQNKAAGSVARNVWLAAFAVILAGEAASCIIAARADTWWNKDYERSRSVAEIVNHAPRPIVVSDYFSPSILALSFYLDPNVPLRLNLKCGQCVETETVRSNKVRSTTGFDTVFTLQAAEPASAERSEWIDPLPFPPRPRPLNMFLSI